jgi:HSP20 family protein
MNKKIFSLGLVTLLSSNIFASPFFDEYFNSDIARVQKMLDTIHKDMRDIPNINLSVIYPPIDIYDTNSSYVIDVFLAGIKKENIKVTINDNRVLTIEGFRDSLVKSDKTKSGYKTLKQESFVGKFKRVFTINDDSDKDNIKISFTDGVLNIDIPKIKNFNKLNTKTLTIE